MADQNGEALKPGDVISRKGAKRRVVGVRRGYVDVVPMHRAGRVDRNISMVLDLEPETGLPSGYRKEEG